MGKWVVFATLVIPRRGAEGAEVIATLVMAEIWCEKMMNDELIGVFAAGHCCIKLLSTKERIERKERVFAAGLLLRCLKCPFRAHMWTIFTQGLH